MFSRGIFFALPRSEGEIIKDRRSGCDFEVRGDGKLMEDWWYTLLQPNSPC